MKSIKERLNDKEQMDRENEGYYKYIEQLTRRVFKELINILALEDEIVSAFHSLEMKLIALDAIQRYLLIILRTVSSKSDNTVSMGYSDIMGYLGINIIEKISKLIKEIKEKEYVKVKCNGRYKSSYKLTKDYLISSSWCYY